MTRKILLIEHDAAFAGQLSEALEAKGFDVRITGDGKEGLDLAGDLHPDAIVLSVELPKMSGYIICGKLKKEDALKGIPLVLTSSEATRETFEKHRQLKGRAEEYLLKPFEPEDLVATIGALVGLPEPSWDSAAMAEPAFDEDDGEGEVLALDEELDLDALPSDADAAPAVALDLDALPSDDDASSSVALDLDSLPSDEDASPALAALDLDALPDEPPLASGSLEDDALKLLDDAFDASWGGADAAPASGSAPSALPDLGDGLDAPPSRAAADAEEALDALGLDDPEPADVRPSISQPTRAPARATLVGVAAIAPAADAAALAAKDRELTAKDRELAELRQQLAAATDRLRAAEDAARAAAGDAEARVRAADDRARDAEERLRTAEGRVEELDVLLAEARRRGDDLDAELRRVEGDAGRVEALERELEEARTELTVARGEVDGARSEVDERTAELRKRIAELEAQHAKNEERVLKAYQKIKGDEKVREKARKAVTIALQLLDEGLPADGAAEARAKITALSSGRE